MHKYNILIVEDEFINAQFLKKAIVKLGHNVIDTLETGKEAVDIITKETIDIVFMDINLDGSMDGISCAKKINQHKKIPIIYTTAFSDSQTIAEATDTNLFGYLIKPFDYHDIEVALAIAIKQNYTQNRTIKKKTNPLFTQLNNNYKYYKKTQTLMKDEHLIKLSKKESDIFYYLFLNLNQVVTNTYLNNQIWIDKQVATSTIRDTILRLRKKVPDLNIRTVSGLGYVLDEL
ncbi:MAG: Two-component system response regulator [uncultured Sulfurovum sp.]|uniref:Two-component system response regulator n=1 Tax=uncultured Sulfurovum sp. TaxID=269237 RepID=A0A6S6TMY8_9BACT|nr:MAG: Two-component system response regulator [uncultured Sulfurovum sp.]